MSLIKHKIQHSMTAQHVKRMSITTKHLLMHSAAKCQQKSANCEILDSLPFIKGQNPTHVSDVRSPAGGADGGDGGMV